MNIRVRESADRLGSVLEKELLVPVGRAKLSATWSVSPGARAAVLFAHGSGSSRFSPRNRFVAETLRSLGLGTLLLDLLTPAEAEVDDRTRELRFDIELLASRLLGATAWLAASTEGGSLRFGYFGASTGAAAALIAAAERPGLVHAVVSRGGRPDLALDSLSKVKAPTLLIVGGRDVPVLEMNRNALSAMRCEKRLEIVAGATHLFEQPGTLERVARLAGDWFLTFLPSEKRGAERR